MFTAQLETYGVLIFRSTPITMQGAPVDGSQLIVLLPGNNVPNQFKLGPPNVATPAEMLPPEVPPVELIWAPVGTVARPKELFNARNASQLTVSYMMPPPPRSTVRPVPKTSHAKPARGAKFFRS